MKKLMVFVFALIFLFTGTAYAGLVAHWAFDNMNNPVKDDWNGHDGVKHGATWGSNGVQGGAMSFDGSDDYISVPSHTDLDLDVYSLSAWVKPFQDTGGAILSHGEDDNDKMQYSLYASSALYIYSPPGSPYDMWSWYEDSSDYDYYLANSSPLTLDTWYFVAATRDSSGTFKLYINGQIEDSAFSTQNPSSADWDLTIG